MAKTPIDPPIEEPKKRPRVSIRDRRRQNPFGEPSATIAFKRKGISPRWFNDDARHGQVHRAKELGWEPVTLDMVANVETLGPYELNVAQNIVRGERGREVLLWMPTEDRDAIQVAKTVENNRRMGNPNVQRNDTLEAFGMSNPDTAEFMSSHDVTVHGGIKTMRERIERADEPV